ncbi:MAG: UDP-N-acetylglucosamine 2-epimerase (non-hydrolyzing) [Clostridia bacterium]|nr:UDP-N-acetylglucosamine 2-epimerase (non-hydrolyzing) [Clostridia bacterium]
MMRILIIFGTRPEAIKMCPLILELKKRKNAEVKLCVTGQHREMLDAVLSCFRVTPDYDLAVMKQGQTLFDVTSRVLEGLEPILRAEAPDVVLVHGDTTTTYAAALAAFYLHIPVGHVEAGLRTGNLESPFPEEFNRRSVSILSRYDFAPTEKARENLLAEGKDPRGIFVTGNTAIDALKTTVRDDYRHPLLDRVEGKKLLLVTAHRRENLGEPLRGMLRAIRRLVEEREDVAAVYPMHLNPEVRKAAHEVFDGCERVLLTEPLDVLDFHNFMAKSFLIFTDSGGIQEEAPSLGKPVIVMRDTTERPEGIEAGTLILAGNREEPVYLTGRRLLEDEELYRRMSRASNPYGDGNASRRIADVLLEGKSAI